MLKLSTPMADDMVVMFEADVVPLHVSLLLGLDVLPQLKPIVDFEDR